jgi:hypothetical protein
MLLAVLAHLGQELVLTLLLRVRMGKSLINFMGRGRLPIFFQVIHIVACFANARIVEARSLETGAQQKNNECL